MNSLICIVINVGSSTLVLVLKVFKHLFEGLDDGTYFTNESICTYACFQAYYFILSAVASHTKAAAIRCSCKYSALPRKKIESKNKNIWGFS